MSRLLVISGWGFAAYFGTRLALHLMLRKMA